MIKQFYKYLKVRFSNQYQYQNILKKDGVTIGENYIIGCGAVVTKSISQIKFFWCTSKID